MTAAPTATELLSHPVVRAAIDSAWADSKADDPAARHEEGGWIYLELASGVITVERAATGEQQDIDLFNPPTRAGCVIVGKFHTHPNPSDKGWKPGPSTSDVQYDEMHGVPDLIRSDQGVHVSGPESRRGGLSGPPGYPE